MRKHTLRHKERGMALLIALLALLLISAIGMGMIYMANTETSVNANYRDTQVAFFAMRGGLEEMRDRLRTNAPSPVTPPTAMPSTTNPGSIVYITNPAGASDSVLPATAGNTYFDDEFCHEQFSGLPYQAPGTACTSSPPSAAVTYTASIAPFTNTPSALKYKWVRITQKQNGTFPNNLVAPVDATHPLSSQVCWNTSTSQEVVATSLGYTTCQQAFANGFMVQPIYIVTSLAYTPQGSRRIGQYEVAAINLTPPTAGLALDGPGSGANFNPPNSNNALVDGFDGSAPSGLSPPAVPGCSTVPGASVPAIGTTDLADQQTIAANLTHYPGNFTGTAPTYPLGVSATPSVVDMGSDLGGTGQLTNWSTPTQLNTLAAEIADGADATYTCGMTKPTACSGTYGTVANPQITYVNGSLILGGGSGVLVVTGTLYINGPMQFNGLILIIGQGAVDVAGGGNGVVYGSFFAAQTNSSTSPYAQLASLGPPQFTWHGGGKAAIYYNSCWTNLANGLHYAVIASREEMY